MTARVRPEVAAMKRSSQVAADLRRLAGLLVALALVFAPWCWGCAWPEGIHELDLLLLAATVCWLPGAALGPDRVPRVLIAAVMVILAQGWLLALNGRSIYAEATGLFAPLEQPVGWLPGSVERDLSLETMARITAILGTALVAASLGKERAWREGFVTVIITTAVSIVMLGCAQRWCGATDIFWNTTRRLDYFFATYRNVTNAGEYLNLALPLAIAAAWVAQDRSSWKKAAAICALAVLGAGSCIGGSKAAPMVSAGLVLAFAAGNGREMRRRFTDWRTGIAIFLGLAAVGLISWGGGLGVSQDRWHRLFVLQGEATLCNRLVVDRAAAAGLGRAGWLGEGPGTFPVIFPALQERAPGTPAGRWLAAHNDYLQTELEWGAGGTLAWSFYLFGAVGALIHGLRHDDWRTSDRVWALGLLLALGGVAAMALVDFPLQVASLELDVAVLAGVAWSSFSWPRARVSRP